MLSREKVEATLRSKGRGDRIQNDPDPVAMVRRQEPCAADRNEHQ